MPSTKRDHGPVALSGRRLTDDERSDAAARVRRDGYCVLPGFFDPELVERWRSAFAPLLAERIRARTAAPRGPARFYVSLPFVRPWADPVVYEDPDVLAIVEMLGGDDLVMPELASDTALLGSEHQMIHRDITLRSPQLPDLSPSEPFQFAVNWPLVDVVGDNGPFEVAPGTHLWSDEEARDRVRAGEVERMLIPLMMKAGDVMIRDVRGLHRGTPNRTDRPRPMIVVGYNRRRHLRPQLKILVSRVMFDELSPRARRLLDMNPIVDTPADAMVAESYADLGFLKPY